MAKENFSFDIETYKLHLIYLHEDSRGYWHWI